MVTMNLTWKMEVAIVKSRGSVSYQECGVGPQVELDRIFFRPLQCCDGLALNPYFTTTNAKPMETEEMVINMLPVCAFGSRNKKCAAYRPCCSSSLVVGVHG